MEVNRDDNDTITDLSNSKSLIIQRSCPINSIKVKVIMLCLTMLHQRFLHTHPKLDYNPILHQLPTN
jgi:hypothetical protein